VEEVEVKVEEGGGEESRHLRSEAEVPADGGVAAARALEEDERETSFIDESTPGAMPRVLSASTALHQLEQQEKQLLSRHHGDLPSSLLQLLLWFVFLHFRSD
jgi:hypothetical protein